LHISRQNWPSFFCDKPEIKKCTCKVGIGEEGGSVDCQEEGKISWDIEGYAFLHVRFDGCICDDPNRKKCDCIIFRFDLNDSAPVVFVVETKGGNPSFSEVKSQIESCIEFLMRLLPDPKNQFKVIPVLCALRISAFIKEVSLSNKVKVFGDKVPVNLRLHSQNINELV